MSNFFEELKQYFEKTPREEILDVWSKSEECDQVGPTVDELISHSNRYYVHSEEPNQSSSELINNNLNPKYTSGFFYNFNFINNANSCFFN
ncbi:hypothetical protein [Wenyingzhuangia sp. 2_MG-2023]|uniref:hypothetical protein n=1 Tax=Wenyingzhuangia sp. 2_MG-2023 TaxID=3062639 RepID=UPI0026E1705D|nr:hypothetical protein [Wenyingzhuangia sp. 2_MG-2023]MDO6738613.1 hypothetical protein [Wenyingzhuangia sp. 2_MG-2023]